MQATDSQSTGIAGQPSTDATAWFTFPLEFAASFAPNGFERALVALGDAATAVASGLRSHTTRSGTGDAPYEHR